MDSWSLFLEILSLLSINHLVIFPFKDTTFFFASTELLTVILVQKQLNV